ncbi:MAG: right-handed parallel beta-helix repeat-containing protein [Candidatus Thermoplasmatota archaeon]|nr:right-handed parallel beta-helix repeat-containing protein [Candidatus Thermoplasmatota archaeon]
MKRSKMIVFCALLTMALLVSIMPVAVGGSNADGQTRASTLYVGNDQTYKTINAAVSAAIDGDTIRIFAGIYHETLSISKSLTFQGNGSASTIINQTTSEVTWWLKKGGITIRDIGFEASRDLQSWAIRTDPFNISGGSYITIQRCSFKDAHHGVYFKSSNDNLVLDCFFYNSQICFTDSMRNIIRNITVLGGNIYLDNSNDDLVENCTVAGCDIDRAANIQVVGDRNTVKGCRVNDTEKTGIQVNGDDNTIIGNTLTNNTWGGIHLFGCRDNSISNNTIKGNAYYGIQAVGTTKNNIIRYNEFIDNDEYAIYFGSSGYAIQDNEIAYNNFINNGGLDKQAYDNYGTNDWNASGGGNYWSDHTNYDVNNDHFADRSYQIDGEGGDRDYKPFASRLLFPNPPKITTIDVTNAYTNQNYSVTYKVFDWDTEASKLKWTLNTNASWLGFTGSWLLHGVPRVSTSSYWVNLSVTDGNNMDFTNFTLNVTNNNLAPKITTADVPVCFEDQLYRVDYEADDTDELYWEMETSAGFLTMDPSSGILSGTPTNDDVGHHSVKISVMDEYSKDSTEFILEVQNVNDAPVITTEDVLTVNEGELYLVDYEAEDIDPTMDTLIWSMGTDSGFLSIDPLTGVLSGTPGGSDAGFYEVNVTVSDGNGGIDGHEFDLEVIRVNDAPLATQENWEVMMDEDGLDTSLNVNDMFSDMDGDELQYSISGHDHVSCTISDTGTITFEPAPDWTGTAFLIITASDGELSSTATISVEVTNVNDAPRDPVIQKGSEEFREDGTQRVSASALDMDVDDELTYEWRVEGIGVVGTGETIDLDLPAGTYTLALRVTDPSGEYIETSMQIVVLPVEDIVPHTEPSPRLSIVPYLVGASLLLVAAAFAVSFFALRRRNRRKEDEERGKDAWSRVLLIDEGPTPVTGKVPGLYTAPSMHRLGPDPDLAASPGQVNGGKLEGLFDEEEKDGTGHSDDLTDDLSELFDEAINMGRMTPSSESLMERLEVVRKDGRIPNGDYREIKRKLNNMDK